MSVSLLLDPGVLLPPSTPPSTWRDFWGRLVEWSGDRRVRLGPASHTYVFARYAEMGYPHQELDLHPAALKREYRRAIDRLLTTVAAAAPRQEGLQFDARYVGPAEAEAALRRDVPLEPTALASAKDLWRESPKALRCEPPPPSAVQLIYQPNESLDDEILAQARSWIADRRLRIVGGQRDPRLVERLVCDFGLLPRDIDWLACERHKKPPLARSWKGLQQDRDVAICITGRVGHATSGTASRCARSAGAPYVEVESAAEIPNRLLDLAQSWPGRTA